MPETPTKWGDCGSLLFASTPSGPVLIGLHQYGHGQTKESGATDLTILEETIVQIGLNEIGPGDVSEEQGRAGNLTTLHPKSIALTTEKSVPAEVYGCFDGFRQKSKSNVVRTELAPILEEHGYVIEHGPPDMSFAASNNHFEKMEVPLHDKRLDVQRVAMLSFLDHVMKHFDSNWKDECHIVDQQTSINGQPGVRC